jgi:magnesium transporter
VAIVVAVSAFVVLVVGSIVGSGIPVLLRRFGLDPALASSIFLTLVTDTVGFGGFLLMAGWLL